MVVHADDLVKNREIHITEDKWQRMNVKYSKVEIKEAISKAIDEHRLPMPMRKITKDEAEDSFRELNEVDSSDFFENGKFFSRYDYSLAPSDVYIKQSNVGNKSSDFFHQENRWKCDSINAPSPNRSWHIPKFRDGLLNALWTLKVKKVTSSELRTALAMRKYIASQFRCSAAKAIYDKFQACDVLDMSMGWGDRLSGFCASTHGKTYFGCDPNLELFDGYSEQVFAFGKKDQNFSYSCIPAEEISLKDNSFDLSFTSPPYYIIERYSKDQSQSWVRYKKLEQWLQKFLFVSIEKQINALKRGGIMAINISDVYCNHTVNKICDPMLDFVKKTGKMKEPSYIGIKMAKRMNSKSDRTGVFCEPLFIWEKA